MRGHTHSREQQKEHQVTIHLMGVPSSGLLILIASQARLPGINIPDGIKTIKFLTAECNHKAQKVEGRGDERSWVVNFLGKTKKSKTRLKTKPE